MGVRLNLFGKDFTGSTSESLSHVLECSLYGIS